MKNLVLDNTVLSHFARAGELELLEQLCAGYRCLIPVQVREELTNGLTEHPELSGPLTLSWTNDVELVGVAELARFASYHGLLAGPLLRDFGEAAVLGFVAINDGIALIDEEAARNIGLEDGLEVHGSLWLIFEGFRNGVIDEDTCRRLVDRLAATDMRLPTNGDGIFAWAYRHRLLSEPE